MQFSSYPILFFLSYLVMIALPVLVMSYFIRRSTEPEKIQYIEGLRGFACLAVFVNHAAYVVGDMSIKTTQIDYQNFFMFSKSGALGVQIFFCITGFLFSSKILSGNKIDFYDFFKKRIYRLVPLYLFVASFIFIIYIYQAWHLLDLKLFISQVLKIFGFGFYGTELYWGDHRDATLNIVLWTLPYEWKFYAIIPFIAVANSIRSFKLLLMAFGLFVMINGALADKLLWSYFITGALSAKIKHINIENNAIRAGLYLVLAISFVLSFYLDVNQYGLERFVLISLMFSLCVMLKPSFLSISPIVFIGQLSYSIYLVHQPVLHVSFRLISKFKELTTISQNELFIFSLAPLAITIIISIFTYRMIEKRFQL